MAARAHSLAVVRGRVAERSDAELGRYAPTEPLIWKFARARFADERGGPLPARLLARLYNFGLRVWHYRLGQPKVSCECRLAFPLERGEYFTRREARALCRDERDYVYAMPAGTSPLDADYHGTNPTKCRPVAEPEKDREHAALYEGCDLRQHVNRELFEENRSLREGVRKLERQLSGLEARVGALSET